MKYKFRGQDIKTGELVEGNLAYVKQLIFKKGLGVTFREKPMILSLYSHGGMIYATERHFIDESTIELIKDEKD